MEESYSVTQSSELCLADLCVLLLMQVKIPMKIPIISDYVIMQQVIDDIV